MRNEYDFKNLEIRRLGQGRKRYGDFVRLDPDVARAFPTQEAVNEALRKLMDATDDCTPTPAR